MEKVTELENQAVEAEAETEEVEQETEKMLGESQVNEIIKREKAKERRRFERELAKQTEVIHKAEKAERPVKADNESIEDYTDRLIDWKDSQKEANKYRAERQNKAQEDEQDIQDKIEEFYAEAKSIPEFDADRFSKRVTKANLSDEFITALMDLPVKDRAMVGAYMDSNPKEFKEISSMTPLAQVKHLGKLETKLEKQTQANDPMTKVKGSAATLTGDPSKMKAGSSEWEEYRRKSGSSLYQ